MRGLAKYIMLLLAGILAASCIFDADQCVMPADKPHSVMFTVALDHQMTKATWEEGYESEVGVPFDWRIIPENLRVLVFAEDGSRIGLLQDLYFWPTNESQTEFQFLGEMPIEFIDKFNANPGQPRYRFMILANCADNLDGEENITYGQAQLDPSSKDGSIPMWGVLQEDITPLLNSERLDLGTIWLLRAAAKIEVKLSDEMKAKGTTSINSATLKYYNQTGYVLPEGAMSATDTRNLDQDQCFRGYRHAAVNLPFYKDEQTGNVYVYVTEYNNKDYPGERNKISLEFNINGVNKSFEDAISFCNYSNGKLVEDSHYNVVRNHIYEFEVLSIAGDNLELQYTVTDWDAENWGNGKDYEEHVLAYPTYHNPVVPARYLSTTDIDKFTITEKPQMYYNANDPEAGAFECFFQITAPNTLSWKPVFNGSPENYAVRVYAPDDIKAVFDSSISDKQNPLGVCEAGKWYRIVVFPRKSDGAGENEIELMITYYQQWTDQYIHLYINGEYDHIRWPESGNNPKLIRIKHVNQETNVSK